MVSSLRRPLGMLSGVRKKVKYVHQRVSGRFEKEGRRTRDEDCKEKAISSLRALSEGRFAR